MSNKQTFLIILSLFSLIIYPPQLIAQSTSDNSEIRFIPRTLNQVNPPAANRGSPPTNGGPGSRGDCLAKNLPLIRLVGFNNLEFTVSDRPNIWVYLPYTSTDATSGEFALQEGEVDIYRTSFILPATPGVVSVTLPSTVKPLEIGKKYRWYFNINCSSEQTANQATTPAFVTGRIQKIALNSEVESQLKAAKTPLERISIYAKNGIWYDTINELALLRLREPQNQEAANIWNQLLKSESVGLGEIGNEKIIGNIKTNSQ